MSNKIQRKIRKLIQTHRINDNLELDAKKLTRFWYSVSPDLRDWDEFEVTIQTYVQRLTKPQNI